MQDLSMIIGIIGIFSCVGTVIYFSIKNKELLDELENQDKHIKELKGENDIYKMTFNLKLKSN